MKHIDVQALVVQGISMLQNKQAEEEKKKIGVLRGGSSGIATVDSKGLIVGGVCPRRAHLRFLGVDTSVFEEDDGQEGSKEHMFASGRANEDIWAEHLSAAWPHGILREEEVPVQWEVISDAGTKVKITGRPDLVLKGANGKLAQGLELKLASSFWTVRDLITKRQPKLEHVIQASIYMHLLSEQEGQVVPFTICYASRVNFWVPDSVPWLKFPAPGELGSELIQYKPKKERDGTVVEKPFVIKPFVMTFDIRFAGKSEDAPVQYRVNADHAGKWIDTPVSRKRLQEYYRIVASMGEGDGTQELPPPPMNLTVGGEPQKDWTVCDYCPLKFHCRTTETKGYKQWLDPIADGTLQLGAHKD
jgi:hypothetical protein